MADNDIQASGASYHTLTVRDRLLNGLAHHQLVAVETLLKLLAKPMASLLTWLVIAIALTLPGALWMSIDNLQQLSSSFQSSGRITLYLSETASIQEGQDLSQRVLTLPNVRNTQYISANQALEEFQVSSGLSDALVMLTGNPLPAAILVEPPLGLAQHDVAELIKVLKRYQLVEETQLDLVWLERLQAILVLSERMVMVLGGLLALAILLVVGNTIRLSIAARVDEIQVIKLVGGTDAYIRKPFLYTGIWFGMIGGLMAWLFLIMLWAVLNGPVTQLATLYGTGFGLRPVSATAASTLILSGMVLGWLGAWWSVSRHLHEIEPQA
jgi:cell division transport system permease protein